MRKCLVVAAVLLLTLVTVAGCSPGGGGSAKAADFYKGQNVTFIISSNVGSGTDMTARLMVPVFKEALGANIITQNMGKVSSLEGVNYVAQKAAPDGLTFAIVATGALVPNDLLNFEGHQYDIDTLSYVGHMDRPTDGVLLVKPNGPYKTIKDLQAKKGIKLGSAAPQSDPSQKAAAMIKILGLDAKIIPGYGGMADLILVAARGEVDAFVFTVGSALIQIRQNQVQPILTLSEKRHDLVKDTPALGEITKLTTEDKAILSALNLPAGTTLVAPPKTPPDRLAFLQAAFDKVVKDPAVNKNWEDSAGFPLRYISGPEFTKMMIAAKKLAPQYQSIGAMTEKYLITTK